MISYKDIKLAINNKLISNFNYEIQSKDITEGFERPSFFVDLANFSSSNTESQIQRSLTVQIYFFPTDKDNYSIEVLEVQEQLENIFDLKLIVSDRQFNIDQVTSEIADGVLIFSFDIQYEEGRTVEDAEYMQELDYERVNH